MKKVFRRPSPAMVVAIVALIAALGGTAFAGGFITKKKAKKIANNVVTQRAPGLSVASAKSADTAKSPVAWAHIGANGVFLAGSSNINQSNVTNPYSDGEVCFKGLTFAFRSIQATIDGSDVENNDDFAQVGVPDPADCLGVGGTPGTQAGVDPVRGSNGARFESAGFFVWFFN